MSGQLGHAVIVGEGFEEKMGHAGGEEPVRLGAVEVSGVGQVAGNGAQVGKDQGVIVGSGFQSDGAAGADDVVGQGFLSPGQVGPGGEGVGLDGLTAAVQIGPVDGGNFVRVVQVCQLTALPGAARLGRIPGAHGAVKEERPLLGQVCSDVHAYPNTFLAISTDWRASLA